MTPESGREGDPGSPLPRPCLGPQLCSPHECRLCSPVPAPSGPLSLTPSLPDTAGGCSGLGVGSLTAPACPRGSGTLGEPPPLAEWRVGLCRVTRGLGGAGVHGFTRAVAASKADGESGPVPMTSCRRRGTGPARAPSQDAPGTQSAAGGPAPPRPRGASSAFPAVTRSEAQSACGSGAWLLGADVPAPGHSQDSRDPVVSSLPGWPSWCENLPL